MPPEVKQSVYVSAPGPSFARPPAVSAGPAGLWGHPKVSTKFGWERIADMPSHRVLIACDGHLVRAGLKLLLGEEYRDLIFGEAKAADEASAQVTKRPWDLVVLDTELPCKKGFQALQEALLQRPGTRILLISAVANPASLACARRMGALGYVAINATRAELLKAVKTVLSGKTYFSETVSEDRQNPEPQGHTTLSIRERNVLRALAAGKHVGEIAAELNLSAKTISTYKARIFKKLGVHSTADLVRYVIDRPMS